MITLVLDRVEVTRSHRTIISELTLNAGPGDIVAITGPAGTGKTTLLEAIVGYLPVNRGTIRLGSSTIGTSASAARTVFVSQNHDLVATLTAAENVMLSALSASATPDEAWKRSAIWLERLGLPAAAQANLAEELSGGQHQRVALARALASGAALIAADDPTSELDAASVARAVAAIGSVAGAGAILVVVTSEPTLLAIATTVVALELGPLDID